MRHSRTLWEEGREPGHRVVSLGIALVLTGVAADVSLNGTLTLLFDVWFVSLCPALALLVHPKDLYLVGVLPPVLLTGVFGFLGMVEPGTVSGPRDAAVQVVASGLAMHAGALVTGYALCLGCLAIRHRRARTPIPR